MRGAESRAVHVIASTPSAIGVVDTLSLLVVCPYRSPPANVEVSVARAEVEMIGDIHVRDSLTSAPGTIQLDVVAERHGCLFVSLEVSRPFSQLCKTDSCRSGK